MLLVCGVGGQITFESIQLCSRAGVAVFTCSIRQGKFMRWFHHEKLVALYFAFQPFQGYSRTENNLNYTSKILSSSPVLTTELKFPVSTSQRRTTLECRGSDESKDYNITQKVYFITDKGKRNAFRSLAPPLHSYRIIFRS